MELPVTYLSVVLLWILWCALHSTLITTAVTDCMKKKLRDRYRFYRLLYNTVALVTLLPLVYYSISIQGAPIFRWQGPLAIAKYLLQVTSLYLFIAGARHYRMSQFLGIHQIKTWQADHTLSKQDIFDTTGILGAIRHPWYISGIMIIWARDISLSVLLNNIVISAYFVVGAILEERKLALQFGEKYRDYQKNVSMFLPCKWLRAKIDGVPGPDS